MKSRDISVGIALDLGAGPFLISALDGGEWSDSRSGRFILGKSPWYPLDRRLDGPQSCSGRGGEEKNSQPQPEIEP